VFSRLRLKLALQFTAIVFVLTLLAGVVFLVIEYVETHHHLDRGLELSAHIASDIYLPVDAQEAAWLRRRDAAVRIVGPDGSVLYEADAFARLRVPVGSTGFTSVRLGADTYRIYTTRLRTGGLLQLAALERIGIAQLKGEARVFFLASVAVSLVTFLAGLYFARRSLAPAERMFVQLQQFTHDASHELRTPLAVVNSELDLALRTGDYEKGVRAAKEELRKGSEIVEGLLQLASLDSATLDAHPFDLSALVQHEVRRFGPLAADRAIELRDQVTPAVTARGDERLAAQLIANLLGNALKFTPCGGHITTSLMRDQLRVSDTGPGIQTAELERVFERFYQVDASRAQEGHGLGLAIAKRIAEVHGWRIWAESQAGHGATFVVSLRG
jgi:two-component system sensor histidine kinase CiaH